MYTGNPSPRTSAARNRLDAATQRRLHDDAGPCRRGARRIRRCFARRRRSRACLSFSVANCPRRDDARFTFRRFRVPPALLLVLLVLHGGVALVFRRARPTKRLSPCTSNRLVEGRNRRRPVAGRRARRVGLARFSVRTVALDGDAPRASWLSPVAGRSSTVMGPSTAASSSRRRLLGQTERGLGQLLIYTSCLFGYLNLRPRPGGGRACVCEGGEEELPPSRAGHVLCGGARARRRACAAGSARAPRKAPA